MFLCRVGLGALLCSFFHHIVGANDLQRLGARRQGMPWSLRGTSEPDTLQLRHHQRFTLCLGILGFHHLSAHPMGHGCDSLRFTKCGSEKTKRC